jgi:predicted naringenin-chalcone synthase
MARIVSIATGNPAHLINNDQAARIMTRHTRRLGLKPEQFLRILRNTNIQSRYVVLDEDQVDVPMPLKERNDLYIDQCRDLGERVDREAIARAELDPSDIDSVISVSCTGYMIPAIDAYLLNRLGLATSIRRTPITELGCIAGAVGLALAWEDLQVYPDSHVLLLAVELPSLTFQRADSRPAQVISSMIFTDGAAAVVLAARSDRPSPRSSASLDADHARCLLRADTAGDRAAGPEVHPGPGYSHDRVVRAGGVASLVGHRASGQTMELASGRPGRPAAGDHWAVPLGAAPQLPGRQP